MVPEGVRGLKEESSGGALSEVEAAWATPPTCHVKAAAPKRLPDGFPNGGAFFVFARRFLPSLRFATT